MINTASQLFHGKPPSGEQICYYCGGARTKEHSIKDLVKPTFTNHADVAFPASQYVCAGCIASMDERAVVTLHDGTVKGDGNRRNGIRMYSWVFNRAGKRAFRKADKKELQQAVLNPPEPPFCIVLADSGKKQLIFRAPVSMGRKYYRVMLEEEHINVIRPRLIKRLELVEKLIAATGKPALREHNYNLAIRINNYWGSTELLEQWLTVSDEPISRLALWLARKREECANEYPRPENISTEIGGTTESGGQTAGQVRPDGCEKHSHQICFDFA